MKAAQRKECGVTLLECMLAVAVGAMALGGLASCLQASAVNIRGVRDAWTALNLARNALESRIGTPCGQTYECPPGFQCEVSRSWLAALSVERLSVVVTAPTSPTRIQLDTLVRPPSCAAA